MEGSRNSTFLSTSDVDFVVKRSNPIRISAAEVKATLRLILTELSIDELAPFAPEVGHGTPSGAWHLLRASDRIIRHRPRMHLIQEVTVNRRDVISDVQGFKSATLNRPCSAWSWGRSHRKCRDGEISLCCTLRLVR